MSCSRTQGSDPSEARTRGPSVLSHALYHWATALPLPESELQRPWSDFTDAQADLSEYLIVRFSLVEAYIKFSVNYIWALPWENLSSGLLTKQVSNQSPQLQRLARKNEILPVASLHTILSKKWTTKALIRLHISLRLCCSQAPEDKFLATRPICIDMDLACEWKQCPFWSTDPDHLTSSEASRSRATLFSTTSLGF